MKHLIKGFKLMWKPAIVAFGITTLLILMFTVPLVGFPLIILISAYLIGKYD